MSVPVTLLGLLERQPSHGYELNREYDAYFGRGKPLPSARSTRRCRGSSGTTRSNPAKWSPATAPTASATPSPSAGRAEVEAWLDEPVDAEPYLQTVLFAKVVLSIMLGRPPGRYLDSQRAAHLQRIRELGDLRRKGSVVDALLADHAMFHLEADIRWMDVTEARLGSLTDLVNR